MFLRVFQFSYIGSLQIAHDLSVPPSRYPTFYLTYNNYVENHNKSYISEFSEYTLETNQALVIICVYAHVLHSLAYLYLFAQVRPCIYKS